MVRPSSTSSEYLLTATMKNQEQVYRFHLNIISFTSECFTHRTNSRNGNFTFHRYFSKATPYGSGFHMDWSRMDWTWCIFCIQNKQQQTNILLIFSVSGYFFSTFPLLRWYHSKASAQLDIVLYFYILPVNSEVLTYK